jgi:hypothetical protein
MGCDASRQSPDSTVIAVAGGRSSELRAIRRYSAAPQRITIGDPRQSGLAVTLAISEAPTSLPATGEWVIDMVLRAGAVIAPGWQTLGVRSRKLDSHPPLRSGFDGSPDR